MKHPADRSTSQADTEPDSDQWVSCHNLTSSHEQSLSGWVLGGIGRFMNDVEGLKMFPEGVSLVGQPAL
ncbi:hypothetical protein [Gimesia algae]|uniref:hypothetical protein n=1 Tax=Gimesia algae TaxID=2527971 RepID=UPI0011A50BBC|nr:hypothetical protein [Gimesia algae]